MKVISIAIGLLFLGLGIPMVSGKAENFIVGSASPDNELRNNFDTKKLCRIFGIYLIFVAIFTALLGFFFLFHLRSCRCFYMHRRRWINLP